MKTKMVTVHLRAMTGEQPVKEFEIPSVVKLLDEGYSIKEIKQIPYEGGALAAPFTTVIFLLEMQSEAEKAAETVGG